MVLDILGQILWFAIPFTPIITIPLIWKRIKTKWYYKILIGIILAVAISIMLYAISLLIVFRDGMGPG